MKRWSLTLAAAAAVIALQGCDVRVADTTSQAPAQEQGAQPQAQEGAPVAAGDPSPTGADTQASLPVPQPAQPLDAPAADTPDPATASADAQPGAVQEPGAPATTEMGAPAGSGAAAPTEMSAFITSSGTPVGEENRTSAAGNAPPLQEPRK